MSRLEEHAQALAEGVLGMAAGPGSHSRERASVEELTSLFQKALLPHARRLPPDGRDEFVSAVVLELLEFENRSLANGSGPVLALGGSRATEEADRAGDRVRHRILRQAHRRFGSLSLNQEPVASTLADDTEALVKDLSSALSHEEAIMLQKSLEGWTIKEIAQDLGWKPRAVYALRANLRPRIQSMLAAKSATEAENGKEEDPNLTKRNLARRP